MNLNACEPSSSGVPTTPVPQKAAPSPRYNDITRPRALRVGGDGTQQTPQPGTTHTRLWGSSGENHQLIAGRSNPKFFRSASVASVEHLSGAADIPSPWQGTIALPDSDEETVNTAQAWVAQILDDSGSGANVGMMFSDDVLTNGRVLCQVVNAIASGTVEFIHEDKPDSSNVDNMRSFLVACQTFGVPVGALFDVDDRDPKRIGLCLHVLSRVIRDTVPGFAGPFLTQLDGPSPCGSGGGDNSLSSSSASVDDDTSRGSSTCRVDDSSDEHPHRERPSTHGTTPPATTNNGNHSSSLDGGNLGKTDPPRSSGEHHHHRGEKSFSAAAEEEGHHQQTNTSTSTTPTTLHARCAPPAHAAPSPFGQSLQWPLGSPSVSDAFEAAAADAQGSSEGHPLTLPPQRRPLSLPSRLSRTLPAGDSTLLSSVPLLSNPVADTIWSNIFDSRADNAGGDNAGDADSADGGGEGRRRIDARATWAPSATKWGGVVASSLEKDGRMERKDAKILALDALVQPAATSEGTLSTWLCNLNLGSFANALVNIGVEVMGDLRYVEEKDLSEIGMHGPQIRKLLQNRP